MAYAQFRENFGENEKFKHKKPTWKIENLKNTDKSNLHEFIKAIKKEKKNYCTSAYVRNIQYNAVAYNRAYLIIERSL